ncbi:MAG TPA: hypothetical protein VHV78_04535, partial [Gemmatimonadaceae bacterium]|nr:hypothetical protein [Gemmatimonadaceae bacterium]
LLALGMFSVRLSQSTSAARMRVAAAQIASEQLEVAKDAPRYTAVESLTVGTVAMTDPFSGYTRQTWVDHIGGGVTDTTDYKIVTVQVSNPQMSSVVRKTTVISPF